MPYEIKTNYRDCSGYAVVGPDGDVLGCHSTKEDASSQQAALYSVEEKIIKSTYELLDPSEKAYHDALGSVAKKYGKFNNETPVYAGYHDAEDDMDHEDAPKGIICGNCSFWQGDGVCQIVSIKVQYGGHCRLAAIPSELVNVGVPKIREGEEISNNIDKNYMDKVIDAEGFFEGSLEKDSPCWEGYVQRGMKPGKNGRMVPNCVPAKKANDMDKAKEVSVGDHVTFAVPKPPDKTEYAHGVVERISRSGMVSVAGSNENVEATDTNPVAVVRVWSIGQNGKLSRTDRSVAKPFGSLRVLTTPIEETTVNVQKVSKSLDSRLKELAENYNKNKEGNKRITVGALRQVYNRGIGAYRSNPSSVRPNVSGPEQWAMGRVNAFMAGLRGKFPRKPFDLDLFPSGHPRSTKKSDWSGSAFNPIGSVNKSNNVSFFSEKKVNNYREENDGRYL